MAPVEIIDLTLSSSPSREENKSLSQQLGNGNLPRSSPPSPIEAAIPQGPKRRTKRKRGTEPDKPRAEIKDNEDEIFFVDLTPSQHPSTSQAVLPVTHEQQEKLLLPQHVTVLAGTSVELEVPPLPDLEKDDFIEFVDYDDTKANVVRYFQTSPDETTSVFRIVCKNCGAEGLHKTSACRVQICLTCGARDEHSTRSCPISKICFTCGMKGHINASCPNRRNSRNFLPEHECNRCSSSTHKTNECPTWWRLYEYVSGEDRDKILVMRQQQREMKLGEGGEGYVADDEWCYNCGNVGHWGDDCDTFQHTFQTEEHSAFGKANILNGPFFDPNNNQRPVTKTRVRDWEQVDKLSVMADVGRKGRLKSKVALEKQAREFEYGDDDDWFANGRRRNDKPIIRSSHQKSTFKGFSFDRHDDRYAPERRSRPSSLLERIEMQPPVRQDSGSRRRSHPKDPRSDRTDLDDRNRNMSDRRRDYGPRYRGGYSNKS